MDNIETTNQDNIVSTPNQDTPTKMNNLERPTKKINTPAIILGITTVVFAGLATFFGIQYFNTNNNDDTEKDETTITNNLEESEKETITTTTMANDYQEVVDVVNGLTSDIDNNWNYFENKSGLAYKPEWLNTYIPMKLAIEIRINNSNTGETNLATLKTKIETAGFNSIGILPFLGSAGPDIYGYLDSSRNITCGMYIDKDWTLNNAEYISLMCGKTDWIWLTDAEKSLATELETAYYNKTGEYPRILGNLNSEIKNSQITPYQTLEVSVGGAAGLFYRTSPDSEWQYFTATQSILPCTAYDTDNLKKAYAGSICYEGQTELTVQP